MHNSSDISDQTDFDVKGVIDQAKLAKAAGADRFCMGWAWREIRNGKQFEAMLSMVRGVKELGLEALITNDYLQVEQAIAEAPAPLTTTFTSPGFLFEMSKALISAADVIIAVPCWSS